VKRLESPVAVLTGFLVVIGANAIILSRAAWNRSEPPVARLTLTERELPLPGQKEEEGSVLLLGLTLGNEPPPFLREIAWRKGVTLPPSHHPWLDRKKLVELGFRASVDLSDPKAPEVYRGNIPRAAFLVLEMEGESWKSFLVGREQEVERLRSEVEAGRAARKSLEDEEALLAIDRSGRSRLFAIDAATDLRRLERRYPDRSRWPIVCGTISAFLIERKAKGELPRLVVSIEPAVAELHVPVGLRAALEPFLPRETREEILARLRVDPAWPVPVPPRYRALLALGRNREPWLERVEAKTH
jgi:hypothetical protein